MINFYKTFSITFLVLSMVLTAPVFAADNSKTSADLPGAPVAPVNTMVIKQEIIAGKDDRSAKLTSFFQKINSPLLPYTNDFITTADKYDLDYRLLPAISGVESTYGSALIPATHNPFGWGGGLIYFNSYPEAFEAVAAGLRSRYVPSGPVTPFNIGPTYCPNPNWASRVQTNILQIDPNP